MMKYKHNHYSNNPAFTIVELLVVIVVIGILVAITIVTYTGITSKATLASLTSDLDNASKQLKIFQTINGNYPATISLDCALTPDTTTNKCLKLSPGNTITSLIDDYIVNNSTSPQTFNLTIKNTSTNIISVVTDSSKPVVLTPAPLNPVADWIATPTGDHYGNYYDTVTKTYATVNRATTQTIYDPATQHIYDVPPNKLAINPRSDGKSGSEAVIEEERTNYLLNSSFEADGNGDGVPDNTSSTTYDGGTGTVLQDKSTYVYGNSSIKINKTNDTGYLYSTIGSAYLVNGQTYTYSCYVKSDTITADIVMYNYTTWYRANIQTSQLNKWVRLVVPNITFNGMTATYNASDIFRHEIIGAQGVAYFDACQIEVGSFATSYIPTTTTAVTRNADVVTVPTTNWDATKGSFLSVAQHNSAAINTALFQWSNGTDANRIYFGSWGTTTPNLVPGMQDSALGWNAPSYTPSVTNNYGVSTMTYNTSSVVAYWNGSVGTSSAGRSPSGLQSTATIGSSSNGSTLLYNSPIQRLIMYPSVLSSTDVNTVTNTIKDGP